MAARSGLLTVTNGKEAEKGQERIYTLLHDNGFSNLASVFNQQSRLLPDEDGLTVSRGLIGTYPNAFYRVAQQDLPEFIAAVAGLTGEADYRKLAERFAVRRTRSSLGLHVSTFPFEAASSPALNVSIAPG